MAAAATLIQFAAPAVDRVQHRDGSAGPLAHAVRISFRDTSEAMQAAGRFNAAIRSLHLAGAETGEGPRLWLEDVAAASVGPKARRRWCAELARAIGPGVRPPMRGVLLRYQDGRSDMILTCHRAFMSEAALRDLTALLVGSRSGRGPLPRHRAVTLDRTEVPALPALRCATPDWGCGVPAAGNRLAASRFRLTGEATQGDMASWLTALAVVLARYGDDGQATAVALAHAERDQASASSESPVLALAWTDRECTLGHLARRIRAELRTLGSPRRQSAQEELPAAAVGLLFSAWGDLSGGTGASVDYRPCQVPVFPLTISVVVHGDKANLICDYRPRDFAPAVVRRFARHLVTVHRQVIEAPRRDIGAVELLNADERTHIADLGRTASPPRARLARIHDVIALHAQASPDSPALSDGKQRLCYEELNAWSDRLARGLRILDVHDGDHVGTCLERSVELVAALLGVLKAGAAYVPMDPAYPGERLRYTVRDAGIRVVIGTPGEFPADRGVQVITPGELADLASPQGPPASVGSAANPAYIIYTSGSTGRPKGVVVPHANVVALVDATRGEYQLEPSDVWTLFHSSAFDFSVWEIWGCLMTGGRLVMVPFWVSRSPDELQALLADEKVTVLSQTPSAFGQLLTAEPAQLAVRLIVFGGEPLDTRMLLPWFDRHPESSCRVVNMFGITETTVHVTAEDITRRHALERSRSVGRPLPGWHVYVMDSQCRIVPIGVAGEICVGGVGVSLGYLNLPELTDCRFVPDPFTGQRMYRSGDKGRMGPDGKLEHLGRLDGQVKVRGFRIEPDEIKAVLLESPGVTAAAVVVNAVDPDDPSTVRIDAYIVPGDGAGSAADVRRRAACVLPDYMMPTTITPLRELPLTTNGKLDVSRLRPAEVAEYVRIKDATHPAVRDLSRDLLAVWTQTFRTGVGLDDDFFELGGNSLCAVKVAATMRNKGWHVPIRDIYKSRTIRRLAADMGQPATDGPDADASGARPSLSPDSESFRTLWRGQP
jgi:amino acid adenylation domain-containing protein